jgi:hypothetical protein
VVGGTIRGSFGARAVITFFGMTTTPSQETYSYPQPTYYETYPPFHPSAPALPAAQARPGIGAAVVALGAGLAAVGLTAVDWIDGTKYTDIFKLARNEPTPSGAKAHFLHLFFSGGALVVAGVGALVALLWCLGVLGRRVGGWVTVGVLQALLVATQAYGVYENFHGHFDTVKAGVWLTLAGSAVLLIASVIGPRMSRPATWQ